MKIKNHGCCDLEYAIELKKLGVKQESEWYWIKIQSSWTLMNSKESDKFIDIISGLHPNQRIEYYSAFTVAELGELLPKRISFSVNKSKELGYSSLELRIEWVGYSGTAHHGESCSTRVQKCVWDILYKPFNVVGGVKENKFIYWIQGNTEANARVKMLIYLIKKGIIKP